jgi:hypothetical protein
LSLFVWVQRPPDVDAFGDTGGAVNRILGRMPKLIVRGRFLRPARVLAFVLLAACGKKEDTVQVAPLATALVASSADPSGTAWRYSIDAQSTAHVDMPGLKEHIQGDTTAAAGTLDVTPHDLAQSRGLVRVDLATFATHTFGNDDDATQTKHARTWLEAVVDGKTNEDMRWAEFAIRSVDALSATDLTKVAPSKDGSDDVRTVTMTVHGDLRIHGHKVPKDDVVEVSFRYPANTAADARPPRIEVKSKQPMRIVLKEYEVQPRDPAGKALAWTTNLLSKVAETADVSFDLGATPAP